MGKNGSVIHGEKMDLENEEYRGLLNMYVQNMFVPQDLEYSVQILKQGCQLSSYFQQSAHELDVEND